MNALNGELQQLLTQPAPDPQEVGNRAAEIETIRRDEASKQATLQSKVAAQLAPPQTALVQSLAAASTLLPLVADAGCAYLLPPSFTGLPGTVTKPFLIVPGILDTAPAQGVFCGSAVFPISVREFLSLTDAQIAAIYQFAVTYNDFYSRSQNRISELNQQTQTLLTAGSADATMLGLLYAEILRTNREISTRFNQLVTQAQNQLTPTQAQKLKILQDAGTLSNSGVFSNAVNCNLLVLSPGSGLANAGYSNPFPNSCFI